MFLESTEEPILPLLYKSSNTIVTLLNMISISWDQARELACEILKTLPSPWLVTSGKVGAAHQMGDSIKWISADT